MEDPPFGPLASDDDAGTAVNFKENEDASKRARVDVPPAPPRAPRAAPSVATLSQAIGAGPLSRQEAEKLRKRLENFQAEVDK